MSIFGTNLRTIASIIVLATLSACSAEPAAPDGDGDGAAPAAEEARGPLALSVNAPERAAGTFAAGDGQFGFEVARPPSGPSFRVFDASGAPTLTIVAREADQRLEINGRGVVFDAASGGLAFEGDGGPLDALRAAPEVALLPELRLALRDAGVDPRLVEMVPTSAFFSGSAEAIDGGRAALASTATCIQACEGQFASSMVLVSIFAPWLIPSVVQIYTACVANCG
ncbi:MAG TPA: hypothetical protein VFS43_08580 [Polyangiaceae bacterium]|nr:hypothetical protein [Polyangiaceae bacterium]